MQAGGKAQTIPAEPCCARAMVFRPDVCYPKLEERSPAPCRRFRGRALGMASEYRKNHADATLVTLRRRLCGLRQVRWRPQVRG